jgi:hypothetical protein
MGVEPRMGDLVERRVFAGLEGLLLADFVVKIVWWLGEDCD